MKALVTGASSGIGKSMAILLGNMGYDLILVSRNKSELEIVKNSIKTNVEIIPLDISSTFNCMKLYNKVKKENIEILINNAGVGCYGEFDKTKLDDELDMIDLNIKATHTLTKLFLKDFIKKDSGYILNVASTAAFMPGPLMASYYASKAYILRLTQAINEELKQSASNVYIGCLCPGPVDTKFNEKLKIKFSVKPLTSNYVADYAINKMLKNKLVIIPGVKNKLASYFSKLLPINMKLKINYKIQKNKK